jgi:hypothetical protein
VDLIQQGDAVQADAPNLEASVSTTMRRARSTMRG